MKVNVGNDLYLKGRIGWKGLSKSEYLDKSQYRIINGYSLKDGYVDWKIAGFISEERYEESPEIKLEINDILISKDGTIGKVGIVRKLELPSTVASGIFVLRNIIEDKLDTEYLFQFLKSSNFKNFINRVKAEGSTINHLYQRDLIRLEIDVPYIKEQKRISKILKDIDDKIEVNNKINQELEALAKTIYDYWFVQFDFPDANGKPYKSSGGKMVYNTELKREIPEGWEVEKINEVIEVKDGTHDSPKYIENGYKLITSKHLKEGGLDFENANSISEVDYININKRSRVDCGDILFSMIGNIGTVYKVEDETMDFAIKNVALYKTSDNPSLKNYIYMSLKGYYMEAYMANVISGSIQKFIGLGSLRKMPLLLNDEIIAAYTNKTKHIFRQKTNLKKQNQKLAALRDWLLPMLMNGQVTVGEAKAQLGMVAEENVKYE
ncbi:restriction endonuclease subunit S [Maribacter confluentis]|uniref:Restriction endonuclease subunit S n=1 Tax=Maribacter confluentis TaxID=1656093 RepID=A0ABT8RTU1_9FLAO|nr:restriction endonuclease subunit S [Maribacter confluentis]MDO1514340.1 restriction endonuclease subunit S [Maribacter confluentis]